MSGDAMGMNMVSKGCLKAIEVLEKEFPDMVLVGICQQMKKPLVAKETPQPVLYLRTMRELDAWSAAF